MGRSTVLPPVQPRLRRTGELLRRATARLIRMSTIVLVVYGGFVLVATGYELKVTPTGLVPQLDRSYPDCRDAASAGRRFRAGRQLVRQASGIDPGDAGRRACRGLRRFRRRYLHERAELRRDRVRHLKCPSTNAATCRWRRSGRGAEDARGARQEPCSSSSRPRCPASAPAAAEGLCAGSRCAWPDRRSGRSPGRWRRRQTPGLTQAFTLFSTRTPQIYADI